MQILSKKLTSFIRELQHSDDARKKRWLYGSAAAAMIVVVGLWALYLNLTIPAFDKGSKSADADKKESFFRVFARGLGVVGAGLGEKSEVLAGNLSRGIDSLKEQARKANELEIRNNDPTFFFKNMEPIPPGQLPLVK